MKLNTKIVIFILEIAFIPLLLVGLVGYWTVQKQITENTFTKLDAIAQIQKNRLQDTLGNKQNLLNLFVNRPILFPNLGSLSATPPSALQTALDKNIFQSEASGTNIREVFLVNTRGIIVSSTDSSAVGKDVSAEDFFKAGINHNDISILKKDSGTGVISQYLVRPLIQSGATLGMVAIVVDADDIISLANDYTGLGGTGETELVKNDGAGNALFLAPTRLDKDAGLVRIESKDTRDTAGIHAIAGEEEILNDAVDYRDVPVFAATRYIKGVDWGIVVKIDRAEALAPVKKLQEEFFLLTSVTGFLIILIGISVSRSITEPIAKLIPAVNNIAQGDLSQSIDITSHDEIGALGQAFNTMATKLKESYATLEKKVLDRTAELQNANRVGQSVLEDLQVEKIELAAAKAKDEALLGGIGDGVIATDEKARITLMNKAAEMLLGMKSESVLGKVITNVIGVEDEQGTPIPLQKRPIGMALATGTTTTTTTTGLTYYYVRKDGTKFPAAITVTPVIVDGKVAGTIEVFRDTTREKDIDKAKTEIVSLASHQLRTPLTAINWYVEMLQDGDAGALNKKQKEFLSEVYTASQRMVKLVEALLDVSRIELGTFTASPQKVNMPELAQSVIDDLQHQIRARKLHFTKSFSDHLPAFTADPKLLQMVLQNLLSNAIKYTPQGGQIELSIAPDKKKPNIIITVSDNGYGIPRDQQDKIFTRMFRADNARRQDPGGTGLGLYIVKSIVENSYGTIEFQSEENKGTTFTVSLPVKQSGA